MNKQQPSTLKRQVVFRSCGKLLCACYCRWGETESTVRHQWVHRIHVIPKVCVLPQSPSMLLLTTDMMIKHLKRRQQITLCVLAGLGVDGRLRGLRNMPGVYMSVSSSRIAEQENFRHAAAVAINMPTPTAPAHGRGGGQDRSRLGARDVDRAADAGCEKVGFAHGSISVPLLRTISAKSANLRVTRTLQNTVHSNQDYHIPPARRPHTGALSVCIDVCVCGKSQTAKVWMDQRYCMRNTFTRARNMFRTAPKRMSQK